MEGHISKIKLLYKTDLFDQEYFIENILCFQWEEEKKSGKIVLDGKW